MDCFLGVFCPSLGWPMSSWRQGLLAIGLGGGQCGVNSSVELVGSGARRAFVGQPSAESVVSRLRGMCLFMNREN